MLSVQGSPDILHPSLGGDPLQIIVSGTSNSEPVLATSGTSVQSRQILTYLFKLHFPRFHFVGLHDPFVVLSPPIDNHFLVVDLNVWYVHLRDQGHTRLQTLLPCRDRQNFLSFRTTWSAVMRNNVLQLFMHIVVSTITLMTFISSFIILPL